MDVDGGGLNELDEHVDFGIVQQSECLFIILGWVLIGVYVVLVGLDEASPLSLHEIHNYKEEVPLSFLKLFLTRKLIITDGHQELYTLL